MYQEEYVDVLLEIKDELFYIVEQRKFYKGSNEAEEAKQVMSALAFRAIKDGGKIYRKVGDAYVEIHPNIDYPKLLELVRTMEAKEIHNFASSQNSHEVVSSVGSQEQSLSSGRSR